VGAAVACFALVFPAYFAILLILIFLGTVEDNVYVDGAFKGIIAASVALILVTAIQMGRRILRNVTSWVIAVLSFVAIVLLSANAIYAILGGGLIGYFQYLYRKNKEATGS
jgi:chromate transporter